MLSENGMKLLKTMDLKELKKLATGGDAQAQAVLAHCYEFGFKGAKYDSVKAFEWFQKSSQQNHPDGLCGLAYEYYLGVGRDGEIVIKRDIEKARELWMKAASLGSVGAMDKLRKNFPDEMF